MKRAAWLGSWIAIVALASVGCTVQVAGQQDEPLDQTGQGLDSTQSGANPGSRGASFAPGARTGVRSHAVGSTDPTKPTPDPWRDMGLEPTKPTPDPWHSGGFNNKSNSSQNNDPQSRSATPGSAAQSGAAQSSAN